MAYVINRYNESVLTVVEDYTVNDSTIDIKLVGRHYVDYGEIQNENFLFLLENFSNPNPPDRSISGQLWFNSYTNKINVFDGDQYIPVGIPHVSSIPPTNITQGELWWDSANEQLYSFAGHEYILVGPEHDRKQEIDFWWDENNKKLYVKEKDDDDAYEFTKIGPEIDEFIALSHIM